MNKIEWTESEDLNIDGCSSTSSLSTRAESINSNSSPPNCVSIANNSKLNLNDSNKSNQQDSLSDAELSDFSMNESDEDEFRSRSNSGIIKSNS